MIFPLSIDASPFTFHNFTILYRVLCARLILRCLLCFSCFWREMWTIRGNWGAIINIYNVLITIQRPARWLSQWQCLYVKLVYIKKRIIYCLNNLTTVLSGKTNFNKILWDWYTVRYNSLVAQKGKRSWMKYLTSTGEKNIIYKS